MALVRATFVGPCSKSSWRGFSQRGAFPPMVNAEVIISRRFVREAWQRLFAESNLVIVCVAITAIAAMLLNPYGIELPYFSSAHGYGSKT